MTEEAELLGARRVRDLLRRHDVMLTKSLGQNFVVDPNTIRKIVDLAQVSDEDHVLEIGAGAGSLSVALAARAATVTAVEIDDRLRPLLEETLSDVTNVEVIYTDVLALDLTAIPATKVVANLPYNIAAQTVIKVLQEAGHVESLVVMTQREVGERLAAAPRSKVYGLTSVLVGFYATASVVARVSRSVFFPAPKVDSVLVRITRHGDVERDIEGAYIQVARAAFAQRRKNVRNSLSSVWSLEVVERAVRDADVAPDARPETLGVNDFIRLAHALA